MVNDIKREIENKTKDLTNLIREYSRLQKGLWQQVGVIAPEVKKKSVIFNFQSRVCYDLRIDGYKDVYYLKHHFFADKYENGHLAVTPSTCVDLKTGELVYAGGKYGLVPNSLVLKLSEYFDHCLNADRALAKLNAEDRELDSFLQKVEEVLSRR